MDENIALLRSEMSTIKADILQEIGMKMEASNRELKDEIENPFENPLIHSSQFLSSVCIRPHIDLDRCSNIMLD
jgi:hypothetical protein